MMRNWENWGCGDISKHIHEGWIRDGFEKDIRQVTAKDIKLELGKDINILEIGCGSGLIYESLHDQGIVNEKTYIGGDITEKMLDISRNNHPDVQFKKMDVFNLDLPDNSQDNIINIHVLQHLPEYETPIKELVRATKHKLYIVTWFLPNQLKDDLITETIIEGNLFYNNYYVLSKLMEVCKKQPDVKEVKENYLHSFIRSIIIPKSPDLLPIINSKIDIRAVIITK